MSSDLVLLCTNKYALVNEVYTVLLLSDLAGEGGCAVEAQL